MRRYIAILLEGEVAEKIEALRRRISALSGSTKALRSPLHITLVVPFEGVVENQSFFNELKKYSSRIQGFSIESIGLSYFDDKVCFLDVEQSAALGRMADELQQIVATSAGLVPETRRQIDRHFHVTLAAKDLTSEGVGRIQSELSSVEVPRVRIMVDHIAVLHQVEGRWAVEKTFPLGAAV